jgi:hypothetical protein
MAMAMGKGMATAMRGGRFIFTREENTSHRRARFRLWLLGVLSVAMLLIAGLAPPVPQPVEYHQFADQREFFGIPNSFNVVSNVGFLLVGMAGMLFVTCSGMTRKNIAFVDPRERWPYLVLFASVAVTSFGSAYYHLAPDNDRLMWDRLPMAAAITALVAATLAERVSVRAGLRLLPLLVVLGAGSVLYWNWSEQQGGGNLNFYIVVQFYSILVIILVAKLFPSLYTRGADIYAVLGWYALAKAAEMADQQIYDLGNLVSGHTAKHLLATVGAYWILRMLLRRTPGSQRFESAMV